MGSANLVALALLLAGFVTAQGCDYYADTPCVKAQASASGTVPFAPLFTQNPTFVYAVDDADEADRKTIIERESVVNVNLPHIQVIGIWLEFPSSAVNFNPSNRREYEVTALFTNVTGSVGGSDNGCGNLLGADCVKNLKDMLKWRFAPKCSSCISQLFGDLRERPLRNLSCPTDLFDDYAPLPGLLSPSYATEDNTTSARQPVSGNASQVTGQQFALRDFESQKKKAAIGMTISYPITERFSDRFTPDDVTVELVCVKMDSSTQGTDSNTPNNTKPNSAGTLENPLLFLAGMLMAIMVLELY